MRALIFVLIVTLSGATGCSRPDNDASLLHQSQLLALGTLVDISLWDVDADLASQTIHAIDTRLHEVQHDWHGWQAGRLQDINTALAQGQTIELSDDELQLLRQAQQLAAASQQLFNPAIGQMIQLWGFHSDDPRGPPPTAAAIQALLDDQPNMNDLQFNGQRLHSDNTAVQLDVGAFAKGYAIDQAIAILRQRGITHAIINVGGDLRAIGQRGDRPWHIGIRHPSQAGIIAAVEIQGDESVFTSGNYERFYEFEGQRYHHIIDPRSGRPSTEALAVTVIHPNAATADAAATALLIAGPKRWQDIARQMGVEQVMLIDSDLTVHMTPAMAERVELQQRLKTIIAAQAARQ